MLIISWPPPYFKMSIVNHFNVRWLQFLYEEKIPQIQYLANCYKTTADTALDCVIDESVYMLLER